MPRPRFSDALLWMCCAPLLLVGAVWWSKQQKSEPPAKPPTDWRRGLPRVSVNGWRVVSAQPVDVARGLTASIECDLWRLGDLPLAPTKWRTRDNLNPSRSEFFLTYRRGEQWHRLRLPDGTSGVRFEQIADEQKTTPKNAVFPPVRHVRVRLLLPMDSLPRDAQDVQLRGKFSMSWIEQHPKKMFPPSLRAFGSSESGFWSLHADSTPVTVKLASLPRWTTQLAANNGVPRQTAVRVLRADAQNSARESFENTQAGDATVDSHFQVRQRIFRRRSRWPQVVEARVTDATGRVYLPKRDELSTPRPSCLRGNMTSGGFLPKDEFTVRHNISLWSVPSQAGELTLTMWIASDDNEWPVVVKRVVRPAWLSRRCETLKVEAVKFSKVRGVVDWGDSGNDILGIKRIVDVTVLYTGPKIPIARGFMREWQSRDAIWRPDDFDKEPQYRIRSDLEPVKLEPKNAELIFAWSQRVTDAQGKLLPADIPWMKSATTTVEVEEPKQTQGWHRVQGAWRWKVRYFIRSWPKTTNPLWFRADIGVGGEGFVPISCPVDLS